LEVKNSGKVYGLNKTNWFQSSFSCLSFLIELFQTHWPNYFRIDGWNVVLVTITFRCVWGQTCWGLIIAAQMLPSSEQIVFDDCAFVLKLTTKSPRSILQQKLKLSRSNFFLLWGVFETSFSNITKHFLNAFHRQWLIEITKILVSTNYQ
jgi:hypothetical protein